MKPHLFSSIPTWVIILTGIMIFSACQEPEKPEPYPGSDLVLEKLDVSCTEAWLKLSLTQMDSSATGSIPIILTRDGEAIQSFAFTPPETLVVDDGLNPSHSYRYQAQRQSVHDNKVIDSSNTLTVTTMDTTSHDFTWTIDTLGNYGSYLNDVAIINENNIWAVGEIDADSGSYNAAHWDGVNWELLRIMPQGYVQPLQSIFIVNEDDIWFGRGSLPIHYDGETFRMITPTEDGYPGGSIINAIWGSSPEDVWFVGGHGRIVHYDGSGFTRTESGTDINLISITGTGSDNVWISGYNLTDVRTILLHYDGEQVKQKYYCDDGGGCGSYEEGIASRIKGVHADNPYGLLVVTQSGLYRWTDDNGGDGNSTGRWYGANSNPRVNIQTMTGNGSNDVFYSGDFTVLWHFNGNTFREYIFPFQNGIIWGMDAKENLVVLAGDMEGFSKAVIIRGYHSFN